MSDRINDDELFTVSRHVLLDDVMDRLRKTPQQNASHAFAIGRSRLWSMADGNDGLFYQFSECLA